MVAVGNVQLGNLKSPTFHDAGLDQILYVLDIEGMTLPVAVNLYVIGYRVNLGSGKPVGPRNPHVRLFDSSDNLPPVEKNFRTAPLDDVHPRPLVYARTFFHKLSACRNYSCINQQYAIYVVLQAHILLAIALLVKGRKCGKQSYLQGTH